MNLFQLTEGFQEDYRYTPSKPVNWGFQRGKFVNLSIN